MVLALECRYSKGVCYRAFASKYKLCFAGRIAGVENITKKQSKGLLKQYINQVTAAYEEAMAPISLPTLNLMVSHPNILERRQKCLTIYYRSPEQLLFHLREKRIVDPVIQTILNEVEWFSSH